jgi:hypothetical protein
MAGGVLFIGLQALSTIAAMSMVESARRDWHDGYRRFLEAAAVPAAATARHRELEVVTDELRRRVGGTFTIAELGEAYRGAEAWSRNAVEEKAFTPGWPRTLAITIDAAFHLYSRGAIDYSP